MRVRIDDIKVPQNSFRKALDIADLVESMREHGQIEPILIAKDRTLVAGGRRLRAARRLGWKTIDCTVRDYSKLDPETQKKYRIVDTVVENFKGKSFLPGEEIRALVWLEKNWKVASRAMRRHCARKGKSPKNGLRSPSHSMESFVETLANQFKENKTTITRKTKMGHLISPKVSQALDKKEISISQAELLVGNPLSLAPEKQDKILPLIRHKNVSDTKAILRNWIEAKETAEKLVPELTQDPEVLIDGLLPSAWLSSCYQEIYLLTEKLNRAMNQEIWALFKDDENRFLQKLNALYEVVARLRQLLLKSTTAKTAWPHDRSTVSEKRALAG